MQARQTRIACHILTAVLVIASLLAGSIGSALAQSNPNGPVRNKHGRFLDICAPVDEKALRNAYVFRYGVSGDNLQSDFYNKEDSYNADGYRPERVTGYTVGDSVRFATKWVKDGGPEWRSWFGMTGDEFHQEYLNLKNSHRPVDVSGYATSQGARYNVVWQANVNNIDWYVHRDVSRPGMQTLVDQYALSGFAPTRVEGYVLDGQLRFISTWVKVPNGCRWAMHNQMTRSEYEDKLAQYSGTMRLTHLDSYRVKNETFYAGIWVFQQGPGMDVRSNRDDYLFQRLLNNNWCNGFVLDNFYVAELGGSTVRYGGIWTFSALPQIDATSSLASRLRLEVDCADGRAGAAVINLTTGDEIMLHADQSFGTASTIKTAILYALLRKTEAEGTNFWTETLNSGPTYGANQSGTNPAGVLAANTDYTLAFLAQTMMENSNNWATNRLIDYIGFNVINQELTDIGIDRTRLRRYMTGTGAPSVDGNSGAAGDHAAGIENTSTPRDMATFLRLVHVNDGLLSVNSLNFFWNTMTLSSTAKGNVIGLFNAGVVNPWPGTIGISQKPGRNTYGYDAMGNPTAQPGDYALTPQLGSHVNLTEAGRMNFANGDIVFFAIFLNEGDGPNPGTLPWTLACFGMEIAREYSGLTTGADPAQCQ